MNETELLEFELTHIRRESMRIEAPKTASPEPVLSWTVHLARQRPAMTIASVIFIALASAGGFVAIGPAAGLLVAVVLVGFLSDFLFPMTYHITTENATCRMLLNRTEIRWADVRRCYLDDHGVKLSPLDRVSRLEAFRGVYLRFQGNEDKVIEAVKSLRPANV